MWLRIWRLARYELRNWWKVLCHRHNTRQQRRHRISFHQLHLRLFWLMELAKSSRRQGIGQKRSNRPNRLHSNNNFKVIQHHLHQRLFSIGGCKHLKWLHFILEFNFLIFENLLIFFLQNKDVPSAMVIPSNGLTTISNINSSMVPSCPTTTVLLMSPPDNVIQTSKIVSIAGEWS